MPHAISEAGIFKADDQYFATGFLSFINVSDSVPSFIVLVFIELVK